MPAMRLFCTINIYNENAYNAIARARFMRCIMMDRERQYIKCIDVVNVVRMEHFVYIEVRAHTDEQSLRVSFAVAKSDKILGDNNKTCISSLGCSIYSYICVCECMFLLSSRFVAFR